MFKLNYYNFVFYLNLIFESLPISSSGHLALINNLLYKLGIMKEKIKVSESFEFLMHIPTAFILFFFLWPNYKSLLFSLPDSIYDITYLFLLVFMANLFTGIFYFSLKKLDKNRFALWLGFLISCLGLLSLYFFPNLNYRISIDSINIIDASIIGIAQGLALLPGISRLAITYVTGCWLGLEPKLSFVFSLTIEFPLILAALSKILLKDKLSQSNFLQFNWLNFMLTLACSFLSYILLYFCLFLIYINAFWIFGIYMMFPTILSFYIK